MKIICILVILSNIFSLIQAQPAEITSASNSDVKPPTGKISNGVLTVFFYIPDSINGFYRGTRFDWSGIIFSLSYKGEEYYGRWYTRIDSTTHNYIQQIGSDGKGEVITGIASSVQGPAEEFLTNNKALGFDEAKPGETFLKIGVGILRRPDEKPYDRFRNYEIVDGGNWTTKIKCHEVEFTQTLSNQESGYGYLYTKILRLNPGKPVMRIEHHLLNTGAKPIFSSVYNHNFFVTNSHYTGPDYEITTPFQMTSHRLASPDILSIKGNKLSFLKSLTPEDMVAMPIEGFGPTSNDYSFRVENVTTGTGFTVNGDRPLEKLWLWAIFTNISVESFIQLKADPEAEERWTYEYIYFTGR